MIPRGIYLQCSDTFLHGNSLREAVWSRKIHVQIMRFTCCLNIASTWFACMTWHWKVLRPWLIISPMLSFEKTLHAYSIWRCGDVMTFESLTLTPFCFEQSRIRKGYLMFKRRIQSGLCWNQVKHARITITHVCFIALTLAGSLRQCLNTQPNGQVFKQLLRDPANVHAWKKHVWSL